MNNVIQCGTPVDLKFSIRASSFTSCYYVESVVWLQSFCSLECPLETKLSLELFTSGVATNFKDNGTGGTVAYTSLWNRIRTRTLYYTVRWAIARRKTEGRRFLVPCWCESFTFPRHRDPRVMLKCSTHEATSLPECSRFSNYEGELGHFRVSTYEFVDCKRTDGTISRRWPVYCRNFPTSACAIELLE